MYQRLVDQMLKEQKGKTVKVYIDMIIKSKKVEDQARDIAEAFYVLDKIKMKLNLDNLKKIRAILDMQPLSNIKEVQ